MTVDEAGEQWMSLAASSLGDAATKPGTRCVVLEIPVNVGSDPFALHAVATTMRRSPVVVVALLDGGYGADAMTIMASADLVVATAQTTFVLASDSHSAFDEGWIAALPIRTAKWLAFGAGAVHAEALAAAGAINFIVPPSELRERGLAVAEHVARISEDVIALKKRAHDSRSRFAYV
jgi:enoyl-CoA hydratase/carnithine racemase